VDEAGRPADLSKVERFAQLLATCQRRVFVYLLSVLHNAADAEEVLQETNVVLWRKFDQYEPGTSFDRWACRIAYYEAMKLREKGLRRERLFSNQFVEMLAREAEDSLDLLESRRRALEDCLGKLSEKDRQLVLRRYQDQGTTRGVAEAFGRSVQGTRRALHRIRMALLACIERTLAAEGRA
jgi:RNA polymerase sigma-70 factor (ECF subfamily)